MGIIDWIVLLAFLGYTVWDGARSGSESQDIKGYFLANNSMPWWAMGLSVMATQASAITFIGTTGQAFTEDMRFVQVYLAIPFAMIILCVTLVPFYNRLKNFSAYEVLEERFGLHTRLLTSFLFLLSRGLALGTVIAAPAYVLALMLNLPLHVTILIIGLTATIYTSLGGISGVIRTDVKQMSVMIFGLLFSFAFIIWSLPKQVHFTDALYLAGALNKLKAIDFHFSLGQKYNIWSGVIASLFLMLSYFGSDQTQVQRYLTAKSLSDARGSLLMTAFAKVPMQFIVLLLGVMLYVFYIFSPSPITFRDTDTSGATSSQQISGELLKQSFNNLHTERKAAALQLIKHPNSTTDKARFKQLDHQINNVRAEELQRLDTIEKSKLNDTNYIFPYFILNSMPTGMIGLIIAAIFAAALSSIDSSLNALSTCSIIDWYQRLHKEKRSDAHYLKASRGATFLWGILATGSALVLGETNSIIELVNQIGSYFYGSILGVFILLLWVKRANGRSAFIGLITGMIVVYFVDSIYHNPVTGQFGLVLSHIFNSGASIPQGFEKAVEYLWLNPIGTAVVVLTGYLLSFIPFQTKTRNTV